MIAAISLRDASLYPNIIIEAPDGWGATVLHRGRSKVVQCEAGLAKTGAAIQAKFAACKIVEKNGLEKFEPEQSRMFAAAPLDVRSVRLPDEIVTFQSAKKRPKSRRCTCRILRKADARPRWAQGRVLSNAIYRVKLENCCNDVDRPPAVAVLAAPSPGCWKADAVIRKT